MQNLTNDDTAFYNILRSSARCNSTDLQEYLNEFTSPELICDYFKMLAITDTTTFNDINNTTLSYHDDSNNDDSNLENDGRISLAYENLKNIPKKIAENYATEIQILDLSYNQFKNLSFLSYFKCLQTLILDRNNDLDLTTFPYLTNLQILWMNNCTIVNIPKWIYRIQLQCPNLRHLSLIGNPGARTLFSGATCLEETDFRNFIADMLPNLIYLDGQPIRSTLLHSGAVGVGVGVGGAAGGGVPITTESIYHRNNLFVDFKPEKLQIPPTATSSNTRNFIKNSFRDLFRLNIRKKNYSSTTS